MSKKYLYLFTEGDASMRELLGGKGANLAEMTKVGLPVPQGFTISTEACTQYYEDGRQINSEIQAQIMEYIAKMEEINGKKFGDLKNPLLVSVRSGARASMPGMMDTILNLGLNDDVVEAMIAGNSDPKFARFVYDIAVMAQASFGNSATSASTGSTVPRLRTYFGYDKGMIRYSRSYLDDSAWKAMLKEEIGNNYPVIFSATNASSGGGHAFVVDGYDSNDSFHVNWGWNGSSNGYYQLSAFGSYTIGQVAYTRIKPDAGNPIQYNLALRFSDGKGKGIEYVSGAATRGGSITVNLGLIYNYSYNSCSADISFGHFSKDGTLKSIMMDEPFHISLGSGSFYTSAHTGKVINITQPIERGDYVEPLFRPDGYTEWQHFYNAANPGNDIVGRLPLHIKDFSTLKYSLGSRKFTISTFTGSKFVITNSAGEEVRNGSIGSPNYILNMTDTEKYPSGKYTITITCGEQLLSFNVVI